MKLSVIVIVIFLALLLAGCSRQQQVTAQRVTAPEPASPQAPPAKSPAASESSSADLKFVFASGRPYKCTTTVEGTKSTVIVQGREKFRMDATTKEGRSVHSIQDGKRFWSWDDQSGMGTIIDLDKLLQGQQKPQTTDDFEKNAVDVDCSPTTIAPGTFDPPSNIQFQDLAELMGNLAAQMAQSVDQ